MNKTDMNYKVNKDECIFLPGHPEADAHGYINIHNSNLLSDMAEYILEERKNFHDMELRNKRKTRVFKF
jgi:flagellar basal body rod protein FlgC